MNPELIRALNVAYDHPIIYNFIIITLQILFSLCIFPQYGIMQLLWYVMILRPFIAPFYTVNFLFLVFYFTSFYYVSFSLIFHYLLIHITIGFIFHHINPELEIALLDNYKKITAVMQSGKEDHKRDSKTRKHILTPEQAFKKNFKNSPSDVKEKFWQEHLKEKRRKASAIAINKNIEKKKKYYVASNFSRRSRAT